MKIIDGPMPETIPDLAPGESVMYRRHVSRKGAWEYHTYINISDRFVADTGEKVLRVDLELADDVAPVLVDPVNESLMIFERDTTAAIDGTLNIPGIGYLRRKPLDEED